MGKIGKTVEALFNSLLEKYFPDRNPQYPQRPQQQQARPIILSDSEKSDVSVSEERAHKRKRKPEDIVHYPTQQ